jgi:hypothetical protein
MLCKSCGVLVRGGSEARRAACLCRDCWERTHGGAMERSRRRATSASKPGKLWMLQPGTRVERVTLDFGIEKRFPGEGVIVGEPYRAPGTFNWKVLVHWDHRPHPEEADTRRVRVIGAKSARN